MQSQILAYSTVVLNVSMVWQLFACVYFSGIDYQMHEFPSFALVGLCVTMFLLIAQVSLAN